MPHLPCHCDRLPDRRFRRSTNRLTTNRRSAPRLSTLAFDVEHPHRPHSREPRRKTGQPDPRVKPSHSWLVRNLQLPTLWKSGTPRVSKHRITRPRPVPDQFEHRELPTNRLPLLFFGNKYVVCPTKPSQQNVSLIQLEKITQRLDTIHEVA